jgi:2-polyprenyl-3-methyl-5-hydroxy-6-metoxy-1,4-benzoquinol methylase
MQYDNSSYWKKLHIEIGNNLKAVGISSLTLEYNKLKYLSESRSLMDVLDKIYVDRIQTEAINILDIGAGIGFWTELLYSFFANRNQLVKITALDISKEALNYIKEKRPHYSIYECDLKTVKTDLFNQEYNLVTAAYCFHHLISLKHYSNAVQFAAKSVMKGGYLIIIDPILSKQFSRFYSSDFTTTSTHSLPRSLYILDNLMIDEGFERINIRNASSFILGGNMESFTKFGFNIQRKFWNLGYLFLYRHDKIVKFLEPFLLWLDSILKSGKYSNSSIIVIYKKQTG